MSLFDFPRINIKGTLQLNPGTANNDDYSGSYALTDANTSATRDWGPFAGQTLALYNSGEARAETYGMADEGFISWIQKAHVFNSMTGGQPQEIIPSEWNFYGDMRSQVLTASVVGVQTGPDQDGGADHPLMDAQLSYSGVICDVNAEGSPPATQFFIDNLALTKGNTTLLNGAPTKGACQWINFFRNANLVADDGSGGYIYSVLGKGDGATIDIPGFEDPAITGAIFRYYIYAVHKNVVDNKGLEGLYAQQKENPAVIQFVATIAPLYDHETIITGPSGRLMISNEQNIPTPAGTQNNGGGMLALAPGVLQRFGNRISADFCATFPDYNQGNSNPKLDFGPVNLVVATDTQSAVIGPVDYAAWNVGNSKGWIFDFDISENQQAQQVLNDPSAAFKLEHPYYGTVLGETDYYFLSNQQAVYGEQFGSGTRFRNLGVEKEAITLEVYHRGRQLSQDECPDITVWQYITDPMNDPGNAQALSTNFKPGQELALDVSLPNNLLLTFTINDANNPAPDGYPPKNYGTFAFPPSLDVTNFPGISVRILPNKTYPESYFTGPDHRVGSDELTFEIIYNEILRTYYLLFPTMLVKAFPLNDPVAVGKHAQGILNTTEWRKWNTSSYMPRTRDLSESRRTLLRAWCRKVLGQE